MLLLTALTVTVLTAKTAAADTCDPATFQAGDGIGPCDKCYAHPIHGGIVALDYNCAFANGADVTKWEVQAAKTSCAPGETLVCADVGDSEICDCDNIPAYPTPTPAPPIACPDGKGGFVLGPCPETTDLWGHPLPAPIPAETYRAVTDLDSTTLNPEQCVTTTAHWIACGYTVEIQNGEILHLRSLLDGLTR